MSIHTIKKKITLNNPKSAAMGFFSKGLGNEFDPAIVNEPSVFGPSNLCCTLSSEGLFSGETTLSICFCLPFDRFSLKKERVSLKKEIVCDCRTNSYRSQFFPLRVNPFLKDFFFFWSGEADGKSK